MSLIQYPELYHLDKYEIRKDKNIMKKIVAFFIRLSFVKKYLTAHYQAFSADIYNYMRAANIEYWVQYVLTGKTEEHTDNNQ